MIRHIDECSVHGPNPRRAATATCSESTPRDGRRGQCDCVYRAHVQTASATRARLKGNRRCRVAGQVGRERNGAHFANLGTFPTHRALGRPAVLINARDGGPGAVVRSGVKSTDPTDIPALPAQGATGIGEVHFGETAIPAPQDILRTDLPTVAATSTSIRKAVRRPRPGRASDAALASQATTQKPAPRRVHLAPPRRCCGTCRKRNDRRK